MSSFPSAFKRNEDASYRTGGVYEPTHRFSLLNQTIRVNKNKSFKTTFRVNIWENYKLPQVKEPEIYDNWLDNPMQFWQNQLNFAVWCATTGCGVSKNDHLRHKNLIIRSVFRFHAYYQIRRILKELDSPLPNEDSFNALNNGINKFKFHEICSEFGISSQSDFRQKLDYSQGLGSVRYYSLHGLRSKPTKTLERTGDYDPSQNWTVFIPASGKFGAHDQHRYKIEYIEQYFSKDDVGSQFDVIGSFVLDGSDGFTKAGIVRINESIKTYVWAILGAQAQMKSSILVGGETSGAQEQFLRNVEDAINSEENLPNLGDRYRSVLQYSRSKVDFVLGLELNMIPSDMDLYIGKTNGYNNSNKVANEDMKNLQIGQNNNVNDEPAITQETFETPPDDFDEEPAIIETPPDDFDEATPIKLASIQPEAKISQDTQLTHDETKLLITLSGIIGGTFLILYLKA